MAKSGSTKESRGSNLPPKGNKITKAERLFRFRVVEQSMRDGKRGAEIMEDLHAVGRHCLWPMVSEYIADVRYKWEMEDAQLRPIWRERQLRKLHEVSLKLEGPKTWNQWIRVQELIARVEGNLAPEKVDVTTRTDEFEGWSVTELRQYVETDGRFIPERFRSARASKGNGSSLPWEHASKGNGAAGSMH